MMIRAPASEAGAAAAASTPDFAADGAPELVLIDFGLSSSSTVAEDKATQEFILSVAGSVVLGIWLPFRVIGVTFVIQLYLCR